MILSTQNPLKVHLALWEDHFKALQLSSGYCIMTSLCGGRRQSIICKWKLVDWNVGITSYQWDITRGHLHLYSALHWRPHAHNQGAHKNTATTTTFLHVFLLLCSYHMVSSISSHSGTKQTTWTTIPYYNQHTLVLLFTKSLPFIILCLTQSVVAMDECKSLLLYS